MRTRKLMPAGLAPGLLLILAALPGSALAQQGGASELERQVDAATAAPARAAGAGRPGAVIVGRRNPLRGSDRRLSILIMSLPPGGEHARNRADIVGWFQRQVDLHRDPDRATGEQLQMMQRASAPPAGADADVAGAFQ